MQNCKIKKHYKICYTQIDNILVNDMELSFQAKGLFLYIWSKPNDWQVNVKAMQYHCIDKQTKIYSALKELENRGYLIRKRYYENGKVAGINYNFSDTKEFFFDQDELNQENLNQVELNKESHNEYINIQKKDNTKERYIQKKDNTNTTSGFSNKKEIPVSADFTHTQSVVKENLTTQKQYEKDFEEFYEAFEGVHPQKQPKRAEKVFPKWKNACKTHTKEQILHSVQKYAEYLMQASWRQKKDVIAWLNGAMYEVDWENEKLQEQQKSRNDNIKYTISEKANVIRQMAEHTKQKQFNNDQNEYPF